VHFGRITHGALRVGDAVELRVEGERRRKLRANHSVTHLLHQALRHRLGEHVTQKGSLVAPDRLRFDFSHPRPLTAEDLAVIEAAVHAQIRANAEVRTRLLTPEHAVAEGALALLGEKYGEEVRAAPTGGAPLPSAGKAPDSRATANRGPAPTGSRSGRSPLTAASSTMCPVAICARLPTI